LKKPEKFDVIIAGSSLAEFSAGIVLQKFFGKNTAIVTGIDNNKSSQSIDFLSASLFTGQMEPDSFIRKISNYLTDNKLTWKNFHLFMKGIFIQNGGSIFPIILLLTWVN
jgi:anaerobic glycerol-3-phosphate dehydrogenase